MKKELLQKKMYFIKREMLFNLGILTNKITGFDDEIFEKMDGTIISCFPVSFHIRYSNFMFDQGTCYDRSLYMFLALDDALLVRGTLLDMEYAYGKGHGGHGWVEIGDYVYDPSSMTKKPRDLYYKIHGVSNVTKCDKKTYLEKHSDFVKQHVSTDINEFKPGGSRRLDLGILVTCVRTNAMLSNNVELLSDLNDYLELVEYDEDQIQSERNRLIEDIARNENYMGVISGSYKLD